MKKIILTTAALTLIAGPALAQNQAALCKLWFTHKGGVAGAAYQPGVDVHGNPVVPADVGGVPSVLPETVRIPVTVDLAQQLGLALPVGTEMNAAIGTVAVGQDGHVTYNGDDITPQTYALCTGQPMPDPEAFKAKQPAATAPVTLPKADPAPQAPVPATPAIPAEATPAPALDSGVQGAVKTPAPAEPITEKDIIWGEGQ